MLLPPGWRSSTKNVRVGVSSFCAGLLLGGMTTGATLGVVSVLIAPVPHEVRRGMFAAAVLLLVAHAIDMLDLPLPQNRRQVPRDIFGKGPLRAGLQFGFEMGTGARTYVTSVAPYAVAAGVLLLAPPFDHAVLAGVAFGLGRWAVPIGWAAHGEGWIDRFVSGGRTLTLLSIAAIAVALLI